MPLRAIQPERYADLLAEKAAGAISLLAPFNPPTPEVYPSQPTGFQDASRVSAVARRDRLDYVMFRREDPKTPVPVTDFPIACERIGS